MTPNEYIKTMVIDAACTLSPYYKKKIRKTTKGFVLHSVGCAQPSAQVFITKWNKKTYTRAMVNGFIDANSGKTYQTMPWEYRVPHAGKSATSDVYMGFEMCESSYIKYTRGCTFTVLDKEKAQTHCKTTYDAAVLLFAYLCNLYKLDPAKDGVIISHNEGRLRGIMSAHYDPEHYWKGLGMPYTMDGFRKDVKAAMSGTTTTNVTAEEGEFDMSKLSYLKQGAKCDQVKALQILLIGYGYDCGSSKVDGSFGPATKKAVVAYQKDHTECGTADGEVGQKTWGSLMGV